jgi:hypothetical protein
MHACVKFAAREVYNYDQIIKIPFLSLHNIHSASIQAGKLIGALPLMFPKSMIFAEIFYFRLHYIHYFADLITHCASLQVCIIWIIVAYNANDET